MKSDQTLATPSRLNDLQAIIDHSQDINNGYCGEGEASADEYYVLPDIYGRATDANQRLYRWEPDHVFPASAAPWLSAYTTIYAANTVLHELRGISRTPVNHAQYNYLKGQALVIRGFRFLDAAWVWCPAYDEATAQTDLGLPLRLTPDFNAPSVRSTLAETYSQLIADLKASIPLLPVSGINAYRATKPLAYALLARTYLSMRQYELAERYADSCLRLRSELLDYQTVDSSVTYPMPRLNVELLYFAAYTNSLISRPNARIREEHFQSYEPGDLRQTLYFNRVSGDQSIQYRGAYSGSSGTLNGPTTSELWLIYAECLARREDISGAIDALNNLRRHRFTENSFEPLAAANGQEVLALVLDERRKELIFRGLRWIEVKRLNKEGMDISLTRDIEGLRYTLPANDPRFALPIPESVIAETGIPQNPR